MDALAQHHIVHRDLAARNVLLGKDLTAKVRLVAHAGARRHLRVCVRVRVCVCVYGCANAVR